MVKWLLTSFHVQIKKLIVAFDPLLEEKNRKRLDRTLVLRIGEVECGTHISEDSSSGSSTKVHNFLGFSRLTNFVKFQGAVLELLHMDGLDHQSPPEVLTETNLTDWFSGHCSSGSMTTIVSGEKGGFSGNLKLSIPWKNGSLDICKVDADLNIEPLELRLQPSTIRCFIFLWGLFNDISEECEDRNHCGLQNNSSSPSYCIPPDKWISSNEGFAGNFCLMEKEPANALLSESHLISDWVSKSQKHRNDEEPDFGASVDQFFECFDGLRNSQTALGNSGVWNWTCSVFSAITTASNLAYGSLHVALEQHHVETNFNASISKISLLFSFADEDQKEPSKIKNDEGNAAFHIRCVRAQLVDLVVVFQVCPQEMKFESTVHHIQLIDHLVSKNESVDVKLQLKHVQGVGLYGWNSVCETILGEWLEDISKNQIHKLLKGLPPIKSLVAVASGAAKLVSLPLKNYRKDHRLIKGMQRGTIAFLRSISLEAIGLGVHLAAGAHNILLQAEYILTSIPPSVPWQVESRVATIVR